VNKLATGQRTPPTMHHRRIPGTSEDLPVIGLGTWKTFDVGPSEAERAPLREVLRRFVDGGGRVIDSSPMYAASEKVVGDLASELGVLDRLFVATKVWTEGRQEGVRQMESSMRKLRRDRIDLMQVHNLVDVEVHLETLADWKNEGRIRYIGITHYQVSAYGELERWLRRGGIDFVQFNYSLNTRDAERSLLPLAQDLGVAVLVNRPFETGAMISRIRGKPLPPIAREIGCETWAQLALLYVVSHPAVTTAIPATGDPDHVTENLQVGTMKLPDANIRRQIAEAWERL